MTTDLRALAEKWRRDGDWSADACADELQVALDAQAGGDAEYRLWDSQWVNVVNHGHAYRDWEMEAAIHHAVKLAEQAMAKNIADGKWPKPRNAAAPAGPVEGGGE